MPDAPSTTAEPEPVVEEQPPAEELVAEELVAEELVVEELSIDGMCGVY